MVSRKGKASPLEAGRGKYSLPASPERVTSKAGEAKGQGFSLMSSVGLFHVVTVESTRITCRHRSSRMLIQGICRHVRDDSLHKKGVLRDS